MSKTWIGLIIVGAVVLLAWTGFQFYIAITGQGNKEFSKTVETIDGTLPEDLLGKVYDKKSKLLIPLETIEGQK